VIETLAWIHNNIVMRSAELNTSIGKSKKNLSLLKLKVILANSLLQKRMLFLKRMLVKSYIAKW